MSGKQLHNIILTYKGRYITDIFWVFKEVLKIRDRAPLTKSQPGYVLSMFPKFGPMSATADLQKGFLRKKGESNFDVSEELQGTTYHPYYTLENRNTTST